MFRAEGSLSSVLFPADILHCLKQSLDQLCPCHPSVVRPINRGRDEPIAWQEQVESERSWCGQNLSCCHCDNHSKTETVWNHQIWVFFGSFSANVQIFLQNVKHNLSGWLTIICGKDEWKQKQDDEHQQPSPVVWEEKGKVRWEGGSCGGGQGQGGDDPHHGEPGGGHFSQEPCWVASILCLLQPVDDINRLLRAQLQQREPVRERAGAEGSVQGVLQRSHPRAPAWPSWTSKRRGEWTDQTSALLSSRARLKFLLPQRDNTKVCSVDPTKFTPGARLRSSWQRAWKSSESSKCRRLCWFSSQGQVRGHNEHPDWVA